MGYLRKKLHMKFRRFVIILLVAVAVIAYVSKPGLEKFTGFYNIERVPDLHPPIFELKDKFLYTMVTVSTYVPSNMGPGPDGKPVIKALQGVKEEYLGLFGRFWKL